MRAGMRGGGENRLDTEKRQCQNTSPALALHFHSVSRQLSVSGVLLLENRKFHAITYTHTHIHPQYKRIDEVAGKN